MQVPGSVDFGRPAAVEQLVGDARQRDVVDHRRGVQHAPYRKPGGSGRCHQPLRRARLRDVAALDHDVGSHRPDQLIVSSAR